MLSLGTDLVEVARIETSLLKKGFIERVFGAEEIKFLSAKGLLLEQGLSSPVAVRSAAANFCAKEAFSKALGTGIRGFSLKDVQLLRDELGKPYFRLSGEAEALAKGKEIAISVSHTDQYATATVVMTQIDGGVK